MSLTTTQSAPSPDYSIAENTVTPALSLCPNCGDLHMTFHVSTKEAMRTRGKALCDTCAALRADDETTAKRIAAEMLLEDATRAVLASPSKDLVIRSKPMDARDAPRPQMMVTSGEWETMMRATADLLQPGSGAGVTMTPIRIDVQTRSGGMNDPREILCGESAGEHTGFVGHLDGKAAYCPHCKTVGKIVVGDDEGSVRFRAYTKSECKAAGWPAEMCPIGDECERYQGENKACEACGVEP